MDEPLIALAVDGRLTHHRVGCVRGWQRRLRPWPGRRPPAGSCGVWLARCRGGLGLGHEADLAFLAADGTVLQVRSRQPPWRPAWCRGARSALVLRPGALERLGLRAGACLDLLA